MSLVFLFTDYKNAPIVKIEPILPNEPIRILYPFQQLPATKEAPRFGVLLFT